MSSLKNLPYELLGHVLQLVLQMLSDDQDAAHYLGLRTLCRLFDDVVQYSVISHGRGTRGQNKWNLPTPVAKLKLFYEVRRGDGEKGAASLAIRREVEKVVNVVRALDSDDGQARQAKEEDQRLQPIREKYQRAMCDICSMQPEYSMADFQNGTIFNGAFGLLEEDARRALNENIAVAAAAYENDMPTLNALMDKESIVISGEDSVDANPVIIAVRRGSKEAAEALLAKSEKVNFYEIRDGANNTPLHWAATMGDVPLVEFFLAQSDDVANIPNNLSQTALTAAARFGHKDAVECLLRWKGTKRLAHDSFGTTAFWWAAWGNHHKVAEVFMEYEEFLITNSKPARSPLYAATQKGHLDMLKLLISHGKIGEKSLLEDIEQSCLVVAIENRDKAMCDFLIDRMDGSSGRPDENDRPVLLSRAARDKDMLKYALEKIGFTPKELQYALVVESCCNNLESVKNLIEGTDVNVNGGGHLEPGNDKLYRTPLMAATKSENPEVLKYLMTLKHMNPNAATKNGKTALAIAAKGGKSEIVKLLLQREDTDVNYADHKGRTPLARLRDSNWGRGEIEDMLKDKGAI